MTLTQLELPSERKRLGAQLQRVLAFMADGGEHTLREIADACQCLETSASARIRDMRKLGYTIGKREHTQKRGLWYYWMGQ